MRNEPRDIDNKLRRKWRMNIPEIWTTNWEGNEEWTTQRHGQKNWEGNEERTTQSYTLLWVTRWVSYGNQELVYQRDHLASPWVSVWIVVHVSGLFVLHFPLSLLSMSLGCSFFISLSVCCPCLWVVHKRLSNREKIHCYLTTGYYVAVHQFLMTTIYLIVMNGKFIMIGN
jgi:hypothetical protein